MRFDDDVVVVTGAGGNPGIGRSYARYFAQRGAHVVVNDVGAAAGLPGASDNASAAQVVEEITANGGSAIADTRSVADPSGAQDLVDTALTTFGRIDVLINNAGLCVFADVEEYTGDDIRLIIEVNLMSAIWMTRAVLPAMREQGYGRIVNTASNAAFGCPKLSVYGTAKAGVVGFTRGIAAELHQDGSDITCNVILPAAGTRMGAVNLEEGSAQLEQLMKASPDCVPPVVAHLAHPSCTVNGETISAAGGFSTRFAVVQSRGIQGIEPGGDMSAETFERVLDLTDGSVVPYMQGEAANFGAAAKPYTRDPRSPGA